MFESLGRFPKKIVRFDVIRRQMIETVVNKVL